MNKRTMIGMLMACLLLAGCKSNNEKKAENAVRVQVETAQPNDDFSVREYVGVVEEESATAVSFIGSGTLARIFVSAGQKVQKGQLIAELDKTQAQNMLSAAQAMMSQATDAEVRMKQLHDHNALPDIKWVEVQSKVQQAEAQLGIAAKSLDDCSVYAPVSGIIASDVSSAGETVLPAMPVAKILNIHKVKVKACVPEMEIAFIGGQMNTTISVDALGGKQFKGGEIVKCVDADPITHSYDIKISLDNPNCELLPGMVCKVRIDSDVKQKNVDSSLISVPVTSVCQNSCGDYFVWVIDGDCAVRRIVTLGSVAGDRIVTRSGLKAGDRIVVEGYRKLSEGTKVEY